MTKCRTALRRKSGARSQICPTHALSLWGPPIKKNCEDKREAPAGEIVEILKRDGYNVAHYDPLVPKLGCPSLAKAADGADLIVVLVCHDSIKHELTENRAAIERVMRTKRIIFFEE